MKTVSWILLVLVGALTLLGSMESAWIALSQAPDGLLGQGLTLVNATVPPEVALAIRGRRVTAAAYAAAFAVLFLTVVLFPYRRREVWSWWAILVAWLILLLVTIMRVPMLGTRSAVLVALIQFGIVIIALLFDVGRLRGKTPA